MMGRKTVLVDLDIRKPNIHEKLGIESRYGVTNYLIGDCEYKDILHTDLPFKFDVIAAGTVPPNPGELIRSDKLTELLERLKQEYEIVIIDSSPIGQVPDASALVEQTDLCLYVIRCMQTNKSYCKATLEQLYTEFPTKIKIVLSDIPTSDKHRFGYYSGGYGYGGYGYGGYGGYGYGYGGYGSRRNKNKNNYYTDEEA
jgi:capsular exopolysaccharide synthesis family protein